LYFIAQYNGDFFFIGDGFAVGYGDYITLLKPFGVSGRLRDYFLYQDRPTKLKHSDPQISSYGNFSHSAEWSPSVKGSYFDDAFGDKGELKAVDVVLIHLGTLDWEYVSPCNIARFPWIPSFYILFFLSCFISDSIPSGWER